MRESDPRRGRVRAPPYAGPAMADETKIAIVAEGNRARLDELRQVLVDGGFDARILAPPDAKANA